MSDTRLTDEQVAQALAKAREIDADVGGWTPEEFDLSRALLQVSADLSALQEKAREAVEKAERTEAIARDMMRRIDAEGGHGFKVHDLNTELLTALVVSTPALFALRSLLPEEVK